MKTVKEDKNITFKSLNKEDFAEMFKAIVDAIEGSDGETDFKQNSIGNFIKSKLLILLNIDN